MELSAGNVAKSIQFAEVVLEYGRTQEDKRTSNLTLLHSFAANTLLQEQIAFGLKLLDTYGMKISKDPCSVTLSHEYDKAKSALKQKSLVELKK